MSSGNTSSKKALFAVITVGCAPLLLALVAVLIPEFSPLTAETLGKTIIGYGALLLAFLSGARLGFYLQPGGREERGIWLVFAGPALGLLTIMLPFRIGLALLIVGFGAQGAWDSWSGFRDRLMRDYVAMRRKMTWIVCFVLMAIFVVDGIA